MAFSQWTLPSDVLQNNYQSINTIIYIYADTTAYNTWAATVTDSTSIYYPYLTLYDGYAMRVIAEHDAINN